ncbi:uncharacterized protein KY384_002491 [Bacidia gigantensis]|uniref:uncharacterized protein n=1 Tax=Bacidia gigantensis TaxID=2732470 RepID=UPI001D03B2EC|nr:uncharacterized protein KY384_002491 [Bacidia gigantensis]KAG8532614.1 hypothetical protein KY384_002491 [Bacidia gigantensis]
MADDTKDPDVANTDSDNANGDKRIDQLDELVAKAAHQYSLSNYGEAAEQYAHATELQAEIYGEMSTQNADLLYAYGRCLYHVAVQKSDVLGPQVAGEKPKDEPSNEEGQVGELGLDHKIETEPEGVIAKAIEESEEYQRPSAEVGKSEKPYFQFAGDENFDTSEEEEAGDADHPGEDPDAEDDDLMNAFEVLDMARVLLIKKIEEDHRTGKGKSVEVLPQERQLQERLADTYDLQAEISLEGERFQSAVTDLKSALELKERLFVPSSSLLAEAHYKLSLALEFSSVTERQSGNAETTSEKGAYVDYAMREEAAKEMEAAIASCKSRIRTEESALREMVGSNGKLDRESKIASGIAEVKEMVIDMEQRLSELQQPPVSISDAPDKGRVEDSNPLASILGSMLGESPSDQKKILDRAAKDANDLSGLVKRKKQASEAAISNSIADEASSCSKRKIELSKLDGVHDNKRSKLEKPSGL